MAKKISHPPSPALARNFQDFVNTCAIKHGNKVALSIFQETEWQTWSYSELRDRVQSRVLQMQLAGLQKGAKVAILGAPSLEWVAHFLAVLICGGVAVPLDAKLTESELSHIITHCEPFLLLVSRGFREAGRRLRAQLPRPAKLLVLEDSEKNPPPLPVVQQSADVGPEDLAVICYTSGTGGAPKGVELRARTLLFQAEATNQVSGTLDEKEVMLSILPLNHLYGLCSGVLYCLHSGIEHCFVHELTPDAIRKCLHDRAVTQVLAVPLYVKVVMGGIRARISEQRGPKAAFAFRAMVKSTKALPLPAYKDFLFSNIKKGMGGALKKFICGGSSLEPQVYDFFKAINIPVYVGYGLTETGPVIAVNTDRAHRRDSVGRPLPGIEVKILKTSSLDKSGEILTRGPHVMAGYYKNPELTAEVLSEDGWFHTGDLGWIDKDGYLFVRGRKKAVIVLSSGKKVHPEEVEEVIGRSPKVRATCVVGLKDTTSMMEEAVTAVVLPTEAELERHKDDMKSLKEAMTAEINKLCENLSPYKRPQRIIFRTQPFVLTTSMKIKRDVLLKELSSQNATGEG